MADTLARVMAVTANRFKMSKLFVARASHTLSYSTGLRPPRNSAGADFFATLIGLLSPCKMGQRQWATTHATTKSATTSLGCAVSGKGNAGLWRRCAASTQRFPAKAMFGFGQRLQPR